MQGDAKDRKFFWCKLAKDFFKQSDIQIIESMDNGPMIELFYLKVLCESIEHNGQLMLNEKKPHNVATLAAVTKTNKEIVEQAVEVLEDFGLIERLDIGGKDVLYLPKLPELVGSETYWARIKQKEREAKKNQQIGQCPTDVQPMSNECPTDIDTEKEIEKDIDKEKEIYSHPSSCAEQKQVSDSENRTRTIDENDICFKMLGIPKDVVIENVNGYLPNDINIEESSICFLVGKGFDPFIIARHAYCVVREDKYDFSRRFGVTIKDLMFDEIHTVDLYVNRVCKTQDEADEVYVEADRFTRKMMASAERRCSA